VTPYPARRIKPGRQSKRLPLTYDRQEVFEIVEEVSLSEVSWMTNENKMLEKACKMFPESWNSNLSGNL
jgi:hypothetical protein